MAKHEETIKIVQITDSHLRKEEDGELLGMNTRGSLDAVLDLVKKQHPAPDIVLATGDIAQDGSVEAYQSFREKTSFFSCPVIWFAGNHDNLDNMAEAAQGTSLLDKTSRIGNWQLIFLDSSVPGKVYGEIFAQDLDLLEHTLSQTDAEHCLVAFHHHPVDVQCKWLDPIGLRNREALFAVLHRHTHVRGLLWGHIHQELDRMLDGLRCLATPSTCVQFMPGTEDFSVDSLSPGYRWLELHSDGSISTGVCRADHIDFEVDYNSKGY